MNIKTFIDVEMNIKRRRSCKCT